MIGKVLAIVDEYYVQSKQTREKIEQFSKVFGDVIGKSNVDREKPCTIIDFLYDIAMDNEIEALKIVKKAIDQTALAISMVESNIDSLYKLSEYFKDILSKE